MRSERKERKKSKAPVIIVIVVIIAAAAAGAAIYWYMNSQQKDVKMTDVRVTDPLTGEKCLVLPSRPVMVSTDNDSSLARPQSGLSYADIVYEVPAEGGATRLEPIYYSKVPKTVGPCRSARPYIVDIAREYKVVFVHHGWSPQAKAYLKSGKIPYLNAMTNGSSGGIFHRSASRKAPHNSYASYKRIWKKIKAEGWDEKQDVKAGYKFYEKQASGDSSEGADSTADHSYKDSRSAETVKVMYPAVTDMYRYNSEKDTYYKFVDGAVYRDAATGRQISTRNILVQYVKSSVIDTVKNRLKIDMCAGGRAILFTRGKVVSGKWSKDNLDSSTEFKDNNGDKYRLSKGNTWIMIIDQYAKVSYSSTN